MKKNSELPKWCRLLDELSGEEEEIPERSEADG